MTFTLRPPAAGSLAAGAVVALGSAQREDTIAASLLKGIGAVAACEALRAILPRECGLMRFARWFEPVPVAFAATTLASVTVYAAGASPGEPCGDRLSEVPMLFGSYAAVGTTGVQAIRAGVHLFKDRDFRSIQ